MTSNKSIALIAIISAWFAASSLNAATIPAGTTLTVSTVSSISSQDPVGRTFAAQIDQDVAVKGTVLLKAHIDFCERTQCRGEDEQRPTG